MILDLTQIKEIILKNPNKARLDAEKSYNKLLRMFFYGENLSAFLNTIDGMETEALKSLRAKYTKSPKDLCARLARPIDKVFSAKGGSVYYNLSESQDKKARELSKDVRNGYSAKAWIEHFWKPHFLDDPNGFIFMEIQSMSEAVRSKAQGKSFVYPTYKSIQSVYDSLPNGSSLEYVFFNTDVKERIAAGFKETDKVWRLVDDAQDVYVKQEDDSVTLHYPLPNYFTYVPAILNSDMPNPQVNGSMVSLFHEIIDIVNEYLLTGSIQLTHKFLHGFPRYWQYASDCKVCNGTAVADGKECTSCKGTGKNLMEKVSDVMLLTVPNTKDDPIITPQIGGFIEPSQIFHDIAKESIKLLEDLSTFTLWGSSEQQLPQQPGMSTNGQKTATQIISDIKPQADRLTAISDTAEKRHKFIMDNIIRLNINMNYQGASVNYGKRFMIEGPDVIWEKYQDAKLKGIAYAVLDDLLMEYYEAKFMSDPIKLHIQSKLIKVEPFIHMTVLQAKGLGLSDDEYKQKLYFGEWLSTLTDAYLISVDAVQMKIDLIAYTALKELAPPVNAIPKQIAA